MPTLAIITVSWNTRDLLRRSIETIHASLAGAGIDYTIVVVDNASGDGTPAMLRAEHPEVLLLEAGRNLGFAGGNNLALRRVLEVDHVLPTPNPHPPTTDYVFLLNPDTEVVGDAIPALVRYLETHPDVAVVGPQLRYADGSVQSSRRRFPTKGVYFWESTPLEQLWPNNPWARRYHLADTPDYTEQEVDWLVGAALLVRRAAIERAGLLDAGFRMYSEEDRRYVGDGGWGMGVGNVLPTPIPHPPSPTYRLSSRRRDHPPRGQKQRAGAGPALPQLPARPPPRCTHGPRPALCSAAAAIPARGLCGRAGNRESQVAAWPQAAAARPARRHLSAGAARAVGHAKSAAKVYN